MYCEGGGISCIPGGVGRSGFVNYFFGFREVLQKNRMIQIGRYSYLTWSA